MLAGILFLVLVLAVAVLITVDVVRTPNEVPIGPGDRHAYDGERTLAARGAEGITGFSREPLARERSVPSAVAEARIAADPAEVDSFERPDQAARAFDQPRRDVPLPSAGHAAAPGRSPTMWVNLSRRSQALVERQLRLIESLEHGEQDQQRLASLSRLNRIAMRMHRNSQNLLVLAGHEQPTGWNQPVSLAHLVEAAVGEVENYERISFEVQPDVAVRGPAVYDAVHLLVELIDNATSFSAADMPVHIKGQVLTTGGALVDITDRGIGMAAKEMAYANQQLDNPPPPDFDVPKWIGLLVVARLAARHGIRVRLNQADQGGLTAYVWLPDEILTPYTAPADPGYATPPPRGPVAVAPAFSPPPANAPAPGPDPAWSARGPQATVQTGPAVAARLSGAGRPEVTDGNLGVGVPQAESQTTIRRLPIFDDVESRWPRGSHEAPGPAGLAAAGRDRLSGRRRGTGQGWAAPAEEANSGGPDES
jgi:signal transduction histidine kinase